MWGPPPLTGHSVSRYLSLAGGYRSTGSVQIRASRSPHAHGTSFDGAGERRSGRPRVARASAHGMTFVLPALLGRGVAMGETRSSSATRIARAGSSGRLRAVERGLAAGRPLTALAVDSPRLRAGYLATSLSAHAGRARLEGDRWAGRASGDRPLGHPRRLGRHWVFHGRPHRTAPG